MKILICGGHLSPALAVIKVLEQKKDVEIVFVGRVTSLEGRKEPSQEYLEITKRHIRFIPLVTGRLQRSFTRYTLLSLMKIPIGGIQAFPIILHEKPNCILSFGGYVAVPICFAGWLNKIPIFTHEQTTTRGLANKIINHLAKKIFVSWRESLSFYPKNKAILVGNPLRDDVFKKEGEGIPASIRAKTTLPLLYITGGNQGSESINHVILEILPQLLDKFRLIHQYGQDKKTASQIPEIMNKLKPEQKERYLALSFIDEKSIGWVLNNASLIISRSGANTVAEILALEKPCLLIPLPWAGASEQEKNAEFLASTGLGDILPQDNLSSTTLYQKIELMLTNINNYRLLKDKEEIPNGKTAAEKIVTYIFSEITN
jgi:UDP-N-acetylglucosamine--N-acetylmuramyl-(pentapeptide) pyrophosphoryl-undecaprenol N-acetylglucosamine transferase